MEPEREEQRSRYRLCRAGFGLIALGLALLCFSEACFLTALLTGEQALWTAMRSPAWDWLISSPVTWCTVIGSYLLWGRWTDARWQGRAGWLLAMNLVDLGLWGLSHAAWFGIDKGQVGHEWLRYQLAGGLGWLEFLLFAGLATEVSAHLGKEDAPEAGRAAQSMAVLGLALWLIAFLSLTHWKSGWPLRRRPVAREAPFLMLGSGLLTILTSFQVVILCAGAARQCARALARMDFEDQDLELLRTRSDHAPFGDERDAWFADYRDPWR